MLRSVLAASVLAVMPMAAMAQNSIDDDSRIIRQITLADLEEVVTDLGHTIDSTGVVGDVSVRAQDSNGLVYILEGTACGETGRCYGVNMQVRYTVDTPDYVAINDANVKRAAVSVWHSGSTLGISRYLILDGGMQMENLGVNVRNLLAIAPYVMEVATGQAVEE